MIRTNRCGIFLVAIAVLGCEPPENPNAGFPPIAKSEPLKDPNASSPPNAPPATPAAPGAPPKAKGPVTPGPVDADAPEEFTTTPSGLKYRIRRKSEGKKPTAADSVEALYKGWFDDGKQFDSSYDRGAPTPFGLNQVIKGWTEGLQLIGEGGMIELEIPYQLGYGEQGKPGSIPPKATLHFLVELVKVK